VRWTLRTHDGLKVARFDREALVFNPVSWQTHLLNDSAVRVLEALRSGPRSLDELVAAIYGDAQAADGGTEERQIGAALLAELEALGLVAEFDPNPVCE